MFESITVSDHPIYTTSRVLDIGALVEAMLYYNDVTLIANRQILEELLVFFA